VHDPRAELARRLSERGESVRRLDRRDATIANARLAVFVAALLLGWATLGAHRAPAWTLALPLAAFVALAVLHDRLFRTRARLRRAIAFHERGLARIAGAFAGTGTPGDAFADPAHPYALDLDLFGRGSLFELLCTARTRPGEERLAAWLLAPAGPDEVRARQRAVAALAPRLDLREDLAVLGDDVRAAVAAEPLAAWGEKASLAEPWLLPASLALAAAAVAAAVGWAFWPPAVGPFPLVGVLLAEWGFSRGVQAAVASALAGVERPAAELRVLAALLARLEREPVEDARLRALQGTLLAGRRRASDAIARLGRTVARMEWARNQFFAPIGFALAWTPLHAALVERWRREHGGRIRAWLDASAALEALSSLAGHAYEHPDAPFPELVDPGPDRAALLEGEALRHPLLPAAVPNDVRLGRGGPQVLLVSGSNMSGKSTYLRTVGVNVVLALAGGVVRADRLRLTPLRAGATLRIQDSLQAGRSRFYAEIMRLKELSDLAGGEVPLLFLLDEILHGTNSHDRRIGAEAVVRGLVARGAIGLVTTHDLALTELAGTDAALENSHFEDQVKDGEIAFDYRLRPGVVAHSNALALMRAVGLKL
jgi:hypothetical protein